MKKQRKRKELSQKTEIITLKNKPEVNAIHICKKQAIRSFILFNGIHLLFIWLFYWIYGCFCLMTSLKFAWSLFSDFFFRFCCTANLHWLKRAYTTSDLLWDLSVSYAHVHIFKCFCSNCFYTRKLYCMLLNSWQKLSLQWHDQHHGAFNWKKSHIKSFHQIWWKMNQ